MQRVVKRFLAGKELHSCATRVPRSRSLLTVADLQELQHVVEVDDTLYLDEMREQLRYATGKRVSVPTVLRGLQTLGITRKKVRRHVSGEPRSRLLPAWLSHNTQYGGRRTQLQSYAVERREDERAMARGCGDGGCGCGGAARSRRRRHRTSNERQLSATATCAGRALARQRGRPRSTHMQEHLQEHQCREPPA